MWKYPELVDPIVPWVALAVAWHITWDVLDARSVRHGAVALAKRGNRMAIWILVFAVGGAVSLLYWYGIHKSLRRLAQAHEAYETKHRYAGAPEVPAISLTPTHSNATSPDELSQKILAALEDIKKNTENSNQVREPFLVTAGPEIMSSEWDHPVFVHLANAPPNGVRATGINMLIYMGIINHQSVATMLSGFRVEIKIKGRKWTKLRRIPTVAGEVVLAFSAPKGQSIDENPFLDRLIMQHTMQPGEATLGWLGLGYPKGFKVVGKYRLRITVFDVAGKSTTMTTKEASGLDPDEAQGVVLKIGREVDLSFLMPKQH